ncbi:uncharacterized protein N0V89_012502 [Didymosphaeria variabile]|uniref:Uncharacterized protein n=1 Tax=Didymosphaeria variabile TaxID=1932322 RepID=A0A9W9C4I4_9PLEO|nr:uncharacterized protein N0V89_012502 [Didymosphaeria variabile]KAJ4344758.1 hypothetical protein N0V89_012502 [Didymosphaeria variabile]
MSSTHTSPNGTPAPEENPFAQGAASSDGFSRVRLQGTANISSRRAKLIEHSDPAAARIRVSGSTFEDSDTPGDGFGASRSPYETAQQFTINSARVETLLRPFFLHTNIPPGVEQANGSLLITRDWTVRMIGANQFQRAQNGQQVLKVGSELKNREYGFRLPDKIIDWLEDVEGKDDLLVPAAVVRQYWTRPRYTDA